MDMDMMDMVLFLEVSCKPSSDLLAGQQEIIRFKKLLFYSSQDIIVKWKSLYC